MNCDQKSVSVKRALLACSVTRAVTEVDESAAILQSLSLPALSGSSVVLTVA